MLMGLMNIYTYRNKLFNAIVEFEIFSVQVTSRTVTHFVILHLHFNLSFGYCISGMKLPSFSQSLLFRMPELFFEAEGNDAGGARP